MSKNKSVKPKGRSTRPYDEIMEHPVALLVIGALAILFGIFFILSQGENKPIERGEAISYSGEFEEYKVSKNYRGINFQDGTVHYVYPHTETQEFYDTMMSLEKGTVLHLLINPNNEYVAEVRTDTEELLNFESSQASIDSYDNGYIGIGIFACASGVFLILYAIGSSVHKKKERNRQKQKAHKRIKGRSDPTLRIASDVKHRVLLEATVSNYKICYRRVKSTNELVINGKVYDELNVFHEHPHTLIARVNGHNISAIYNGAYSFIAVDGQIVAKKIRWY